MPDGSARLSSPDPLSEIKATKHLLSMNAHSSGGSEPPVWRPVLFGALAGGLGWGIRGQYGHETGAMIAGVLVGLVMVLLFCPNASSLAAAQAVARGAVAIGFGGCMTYGQMVGLTHNAALVGNWPALRWGFARARHQRWHLDWFRGSVSRDGTEWHEVSRPRSLDLDADAARLVLRRSLADQLAL